MNPKGEVTMKKLLGFAVALIGMFTAWNGFLAMRFNPATLEIPVIILGIVFFVIGIQMIFSKVES